MNQVNEYIQSLGGIKREWVESLVNFIRSNYPQMPESFEYKMPTYKKGDNYIAFAAQKRYFSFYTENTRILDLIKEIIPQASFGKCCTRIKYSDKRGVEPLKGIIDEFMALKS